MSLFSSLCVPRFARRFIPTRIFVFACLALLLAGVSPVYATSSITAYSSNRNGYYQIFLNTSTQAYWTSMPDRAITNNSSYNDTHPAWRPFLGSKNGGRIAFVRTDSSGNSEIYVADLAATTLGTYAIYSITGGITGNKSAPTWSPDGTKLAFVVDTGTSKEVYVATVNNPFTVAASPPNPPHTLVPCSLGSAGALTSGGSNEDPMWLYDNSPTNSVTINGQSYGLNTEYGIAYVHRDSSGNGDIYKIPSSGGTAANMTAASDPSNIYDDTHPNVTTKGTNVGEISFTRDIGSGHLAIYKTDGASTTAQSALNTSSTGYSSSSSAYDTQGYSVIVGGSPYACDYVVFVSHRSIDIGNGPVDATNLYLYDEADDIVNGVGATPRTFDGPGIVNKEPVLVYIYAEPEEGGGGTGLE